jgi:hypothetical protein
MGFRYLLLGNRYLMPFRSRADRVARLFAALAIPARCPAAAVAVAEDCSYFE